MNNDQSNPTQPHITFTTPTSTKSNTLTPPPKPTIAEGMQRVGKHGKSHHEFIKIMNQHEKTKDFRPISMEELAYHNTMQSAWLSLNGIVYDVTVYMDFHPGGNILLQGCGKECAGLFNKYHPWVNAKYLLEKFQIGYLQ